MSPKSLVTGAAGFLGSHVAEQCVRLGHDVVGVDDLSGGIRENVPAGVDFRRLDTTDATAVDALFARERFDLVYHLAAYAAEGLSHFIRGYNYRVNLLGSVSLINAAVNHGVRRFVFTSSIAVYGTGEPPFREEQTPQPEDPYGISKYAVELDLRAAHKMFGLEYTIFRPHNVYGERQNIADAYRNVVCIFLNQAMQGKAMTVFGDGEQTRAFSYVGDVAPTIAGAGEHAGARNETFNVGAATPHSVNRLAAAVAAAVGTQAEVVHLPARQEVVHARSSIDKAARVFGFDPAGTMSLDEGLRRTAAWAREVGPQAPVVFDAVEVERELPAAWRRPDLKRLPALPSREHANDVEVPRS